MRSRNPLFEESPKSKRVYVYFNKRIGQFLALIGLLKVLSIHSSSSTYPRLHVLHEARSREFKSVTSSLAKKFFDKELYIYITGEKTIHGMLKDHGEDWDEICIIINDGNLLFKALGKRTRERWLSAMSVVLTEESYKYSDNVQSFEITGKISIIINLATPSFTRHKNEIFESTLGNRLFIAHAWLKERENLRCKKNFENTKRLKPKVKITERYNRRIKNIREYSKILEHYAKDYGILSVRSTAECLDIVKAIASENARFNQRNYLTDDDIKLVRMLRGYNIDPMVPDEPRVTGFLKEGRSYKDICHLLGRPRSYFSTISYYKKKALQRGVIDVS